MDADRRRCPLRERSADATDRVKSARICCVNDTGETDLAGDRSSLGTPGSRITNRIC